MAMPPSDRCVEQMEGRGRRKWWPRLFAASVARQMPAAAGNVLARVAVHSSHLLVKLVVAFARRSVDERSVPCSSATRHRFLCCRFSSWSFFSFSMLMPFCALLGACTALVVIAGHCAHGMYMGYTWKRQKFKCSIRPVLLPPLVVDNNSMLLLKRALCQPCLLLLPRSSLGCSSR